jgi:hypothetical protein
MMTISCKQVDELLLEYVYKELDPEMALGIERHVEGCASCGEGLRALQETRQAMRGLELVEPPAEISALLLHEAAEALKSVEESFWGKLARMMRPLAIHPAMSAAALLVLVVGVGFFVYKLGEPERSRQETFDSPAMFAKEAPPAERERAQSPSKEQRKASETNVASAKANEGAGGGFVTPSGVAARDEKGALSKNESLPAQAPDNNRPALRRSLRGSAADGEGYIAADREAKLKKRSSRSESIVWANKDRRPAARLGPTLQVSSPPTQQATAGSRATTAGLAQDKRVVQASPVAKSASAETVQAGKTARQEAKRLDDQMAQNVYSHALERIRQAVKAGRCGDAFGMANDAIRRQGKVQQPEIVRAVAGCVYRWQQQRGTSEGRAMLANYPELQKAHAHQRMLDEAVVARKRPKSGAAAKGRASSRKASSSAKSRSTPSDAYQSDERQQKKSTGY